MTYCSCLSCGLGSMILISVFMPGAARAGGRDWYVGAGVGYGPGYPGFGPAWGYPGLGGGPYLGWPYYRGAYGSFWSNGLSLYGPPVPVYGPVPGVLGNDDFVRQWQHNPGIWPGFGWVGVYSPSPRPKHPSVGVWPGPVLEGVPVEPGLVGGEPGPLPISKVDAPPASGAGLTISVRVPQPQADVYVDGVKTSQTGTDRLFESPPLRAGGEYRYEVTARWFQGGAPIEQRRVITGRPGEVVRVDFGGYPTFGR